jgi:hypothetical protein
MLTLLQKRTQKNRLMWLSAAVLTASTCAGRGAHAQQNLLPEGDFQKAGADGFALGWNRIEGAAVASEGERRWLKLENATIDKAVADTKVVALPRDARFLEVAVRMKATNLKLGREGWHEARVAMRFEDKASQQVGNYPPMPALRADSDWVWRRVQMEVPAGATRLVLQPGLWLSSGTLELDDLQVLAYRDAAAFYRSHASAPNSLKWRLPSSGAAVQNGALSVTNPAAGRDNEVVAQTFVALDPAWAALQLKGRVLVQDFVPGSYGWKRASLLGRFRSAAGAELRAFEALSLGENGERTVDQKLDVPEGAAFLELNAGLERAAGQLQVLALGLEPVGAASLADAPTPQDLNWDKAKVEDLTAVRSHLSLDGVWKWVPSEGEASREPRGWGYMRVPGSWKEGGDIVARGSGRLWQNFNADRTGAAWYERTVSVPESWKGRAISLDLRRVSTDAQVWVDGQEAGRVSWPGGDVDLSKYLRAGQTHTLRLRVVATDDLAQIPVYMGYITNEMRPASLDTKGLIGSVVLESRPAVTAASTSIGDVYVRPSTRQKTLFVDVELVQPRVGNAEFAAEMRDEKGNLEKTLRTTATLKAGQSKVTLAFPWADPRLWDVGQPNVYSMVLKASGAASDEFLVPRLGFREFWIAGRDFYLNGTKFNLRPHVLQYGAMPSERMKQGANFGEIWPEDRARRGTRDEDWKYIEDAEKIGMPLAGNAPHMAAFLGGDKWSQPETRAQYRKIVEHTLRPIRNLPSIVMWATTGNALQNWSDGDPWRLGQRDWSVVQEYVDQHKRFNEARAMVREVDPVRPLFSHHGTYNGEVYTSNLYLNFIPLQEREEWMSHWAKSGTMPFMVVEMGMPLYSTLNRGRNGYDHQGHSESFLSEWTASYLGASVYASEPQKYRDEVLVGRYKGSDPQREYEPHIRQNQRERILDDSDGFSRLLNLFTENTWRSWRAMGVSGGAIPWHHDRIPSLDRVNGPSLAFIANAGGAPDPAKPDAPAWTAKDHAFRGGEVMQKQIFLINDFRSPQPFEATVSAVLGGKQVLARTLTERCLLASRSGFRLRSSCPQVLRCSVACSSSAPRSGARATRTSSRSASTRLPRLSKLRLPSSCGTGRATRPRCWPG